MEFNSGFKGLNFCSSDLQQTHPTVTGLCVYMYTLTSAAALHVWTHQQTIVWWVHTNPWLSK